MIYVDTNILIRLITDDVPTLRRQAEERLNASAPNDLFIPDAVLSELFLVLENAPLYKLSRRQVIERLSALLEMPQFAISSQATGALELAASYPDLDFTDCLLASYADGQQAKLFTFDKALLKIAA